MGIPHDHAQAAMAEELGHGAKRGACMISQDAKVCRRSCQVKSLISAISSAVRNPFFTSHVGQQCRPPVRLACGLPHAG